MFIDLRTSEYIFNISQSFKNIIKLIKIKKIPKKICYFFYYKKLLDQKIWAKEFISKTYKIILNYKVKFL